MLRAIGFIVTAFCVFIFFFSPIVVLLIDFYVPPMHYVHRNPDGSSIGIYYIDSAIINVRRVGFGPEKDCDVNYDPVLFLPILTIPPIVWVWRYRRKCAPRSPSRRRFAGLCAACPLLAAILIDDRRGTEMLGLIVAAVSLLPLLVIGLVRLINRIPSRGELRIRKGLCPTCGYDMRATPDRDGPRHPVCPECGQPWTESINA